MLVHESADGRVEIRCAGSLLPYSVLDKQPFVASGEIVENKRLGAVLSLIQAGQEERDERRLRSKNSSAERAVTGVPAPPLQFQPAVAVASPRTPTIPDRLAHPLSPTQPLDGRGAMAAFMERFSAEQKAKRRKHNDVTNQRKRDRELLAAKTRAPGGCSG